MSAQDGGSPRRKDCTSACPSNGAFVTYVQAFSSRSTAAGLESNASRRSAGTASPSAADADGSMGASEATALSATSLKYPSMVKTPRFLRISLSRASVLGVTRNERGGEDGRNSSVTSEKMVRQFGSLWE